MMILGVNERTANDNGQPLLSPIQIAALVFLIVFYGGLAALLVVIAVQMVG
jgi:hypothetical protein